MTDKNKLVHELAVKFIKDLPDDLTNGTISVVLAQVLASYAQDAEDGLDILDLAGNIFLEYIISISTEGQTLH
jgi:hypothetical protein|tara:strand:+ start:109 stop:327 length:219 start_codon:yes stop_codon:yes gene_type:complete